MNVKTLFKLDGKVVVVTGGAGYLGFQMASGLAEAGAHVVIASRNFSKCSEKADKISAEYNKALAVNLDITKKESVADSLSRILKEFGRVDVLINNAGGSISEKFEDADFNDFQRVMELNCTGSFLCSQIYGNWMKQNGGGNIINIASMYGMVGADQSIYGTSDNRQPASYAMAKGGIINFTRFLAVYLAPFNIRVNCISPGGFIRNKNEYFRKEFFRRVPLHREGKPYEIKGAALFLASDASSYVTGHNLVVDGGWTAW